MASRERLPNCQEMFPPGKSASTHARLVALHVVFLPRAFGRLHESGIDWALFCPVSRPPTAKSRTSANENIHARLDGQYWRFSRLIAERRIARRRNSIRGHQSGGDGCTGCCGDPVVAVIAQALNGTEINSVAATGRRTGHGSCTSQWAGCRALPPSRQRRLYGRS